MDPNLVGPLIVLGIIFIFLVGVFIWSTGQTKKSKVWNILYQGTFDHAQYGYYVTSERSGSMVHHTSRIEIDIMVVFFENGASFVLPRSDLPFAKGTEIAIYENLLGEKKLKYDPDRSRPTPS